MDNNNNIKKIKMDTGDEGGFSSHNNVSVQQHVQQQFNALDSRSRYQLLVKCYYRQLTEGCGNDGCQNPNCFSCTKTNIDPDTAAKNALELAKGAFKEVAEYFFCDGEINRVVLEELVDNEKLTPFLHLPIIQLFIQAGQKDNYAMLTKLVSRVFSSSEALSSSFLKKGALSGAITDPETSGVDLVAVEHGYRLLEGLKNKEIETAMFKALETLAKDIEEKSKNIKNETQLRQFIVLLENPSFMEPTYHNILTKLNKGMLDLPKYYQNILVQWWSHYSKEKLSRLVSVYQQFITVQLYIMGFIDEKIAHATRMLGMLNAANEAGNDGTGKIIPYTEFYNDAVNNIVDLAGDYKRWRKAKAQGTAINKASFSSFAFCFYPFILEPHSKTKILQIDAHETQGHEFQQAFFRYALFQMPPAFYCVLRVRRDNLVYTTLTQLAAKIEELKKPLKVIFEGEEGVDEGGVRKEFFQLIVRQIFDVNFGMFTYNEETRTFWFNQFSLENDQEFQLIGTIISLAIYNGIILDVHFPMVVWKKLLGFKPTLQDLKDLDPALGRGLQQLLDFQGDVESVFCRTFQVEEECFGEIITHDLLPNGGNIPVTNENRKEYVDLYVKYKLEDSIDRQFKAFARGFMHVASADTFKLFRPEEVELLVCGSPELDFEALERVTKYEDGYTENSRTIADFWEIVHGFSYEQKKKLLAFCTGSDRVPIKGLGNLLFTISRNGPDSDRLPTAHTCFNHLLLPEYATKEKLRERLLTAINNAEGFGLM